MYKWIPFTRRFLRLIYQYCFVIILHAIYFALLKQPLPELKWFGFIFGALAVSYTFREMFSRGVYLLIIHLIMCLISYFLTDDWYLRVIVILTIMEFFFDGQRYISKGYEIQRMYDVPWGGPATGIVAILLGMHLKNHNLISLGYIIPVAIIVIFFVSLYMEELEKYIHSSRYVTGAPMKQIVSVNTIIIAGILIITFLLLALADIMNLKVMVADFLKALIVLFRIIFTIVFTIISAIIAFLTGGSPVRVSKFKKVKSMAEEAGLFGNIFQVIIFVAFAAFLIFIVFRIIRWFIRLIMARYKSDSEIVEIIPTKLKGVEKVKIKKEKKPSALSPVQRARHIYRKKVLSYKSSFIPDKESTTKDIEGMMQRSASLAADGGENSTGNLEIVPSESLRELYDAVRYGEVIPDSKYLKKMKNS